MNRKRISLILALIYLYVSLFSFQTVHARVLNKPNPASDFKYEAVQDGYAITDYTGTSKTVVLPDTIDGMKVIAVGRYAFFNQKIKSLTLGKYVRTLDECAFARCENLSSVTLNDGLEIIDNGAFLGCTSLNSVNLPSSLEIIGYNSFYDCGCTGSLTIPGGLVEIDKAHTYYRTFIQKYYIKGTYLYSEAYDLLDRINQFRDARGLKKLKMDKELFNSAQQRAAELHLYYNRERPGYPEYTGKPDDCLFEQISMGYKDAEEFETYWFYSNTEEADNFRNALSEEMFNSIGIGVFEVNGVPAWIIEFGQHESVKTTMPADAEKTVKMFAFHDQVIPSYDNYFEIIPAGSSFTVNITNGSGVLENVLEPKSFRWESSDKDIAVVSDGVISGIKAGTADITAVNKTDYLRYVNIIAEVVNKGWTKLKTVNKWVYVTSDNKLVINKWQQISGKWYHFSIEGLMQTGWIKLGGKWYYLSSSGAMVTGWQKIAKKWYYFLPGGAMVTSWKKIGGKWYYFTSGGAMVTGWKKIGGKWYWFESGGAMKTGWKKISGKWYYFDSSGAMVTGSKTISGKTYYFDSSGACTNPY